MPGYTNVLAMDNPGGSFTLPLGHSVNKFLISPRSVQHEFGTYVFDGALVVSFGDDVVFEIDLTQVKFANVELPYTLVGDGVKEIAFATHSSSNNSELVVNTFVNT